jgi:hypothetical protein
VQSPEPGTPAPAATGRPLLRLSDWPAARRATRSCCCPAPPAVIAVLPKTSARPALADLLLCGHHYRRSRDALFGAGATVLDINGARLTAGIWPEIKPAPVAAPAR